MWAGEPSYDKKPVLFKPGKHSIHLSEVFGRYEGKFVIQLFNDEELLDERVYTIAPGTPRLVSNIDSTAPCK